MLDLSKTYRTRDGKWQGKVVHDGRAVEECALQPADGTNSLPDGFCARWYENGDWWGGQEDPHDLIPVHESAHGLRRVITVDERREIHRRDKFVMFWLHLNERLAERGMPEATFGEAHTAFDIATEAAVADVIDIRKPC